MSFFRSFTDSSQSSIMDHLQDNDDDCMMGADMTEIIKPNDLATQIMGNSQNNSAVQSGVQMPSRQGFAQATTAEAFGSDLSISHRITEGRGLKRAPGLEEPPQHVKWARINCAGGVQPKPRHGHRAVAIKDLIILFGGGNEGIMNELHVYCTINNQWFQPTLKGDKPPGCASFGFVADGTRLICFGGMLEYGRYSNDLYELQVTKWTWKKLKVDSTHKGLLPTPRIGHSFTLINGAVYLFGGLVNGTDDPKINCPSYMNDLHRLKLPAGGLSSFWDQPRTFGEKPLPRESHTAVGHVDKNGLHPKLIIYGGMRCGRLGDLWILDIDTMSWHAPVIKGIPPLPRSLHTATLIGNRMVVFGGWIPIPGQNELLPQKEWECSSTVSILDVGTLTWENIQAKEDARAGLPRGRAGHAAVQINSSLYLWSGRDGYKRLWGNQVCFDELWRLDIEKPSAPGSIQLLRASTDSLDLSWGPADGFAEGYILQVLRFDVPPPPPDIQPILLPAVAAKVPVAQNSRIPPHIAQPQTVQSSTPEGIPSIIRKAGGVGTPLTMVGLPQPPLTKSTAMKRGIDSISENTSRNGVPVSSVEGNPIYPIHGSSVIRLVGPNVEKLPAISNSLAMVPGSPSVQYGTPVRIINPGSVSVQRVQYLRYRAPVASSAAPGTQQTTRVRFIRSVVPKATPPAGYQQQLVPSTNSVPTSSATTSQPNEVGTPRQKYLDQPTPIPAQCPPTATLGGTQNLRPTQPRSMGIVTTLDGQQFLTKDGKIIKALSGPLAGKPLRVTVPGSAFIRCGTADAGRITVLQNTGWPRFVRPGQGSPSHQLRRLVQTSTGLSLVPRTSTSLTAGSGAPVAVMTQGGQLGPRHVLRLGQGSHVTTNQQGQQILTPAPPAPGSPQAVQAPQGDKNDK